MHRRNFPKALLIAMNDGVDPSSGVKLCDGIGHFRDFTSFDQVLECWDKVIREMCRQCTIIDATCDMVLEEDTADILCSALTDDSFSFARALLEEAGVAATPGLDFGAHQPERHIRFAYTTDVARLEEAVRRIARFLGCA